MNRRHFLMGTAAGAAAARAAAGQRNILLLYCEQFQHNVSSFAGGPGQDSESGTSGRAGGSRQIEGRLAGRLLQHLEQTGDAALAAKLRTSRRAVTKNP